MDKQYKYLGDDVYASVDDDGIEIWLGNPRYKRFEDKPVVFLDQNVMVKLVEYARNVGVLPQEEEKK